MPRHVSALLLYQRIASGNSRFTSIILMEYHRFWNWVYWNGHKWFGNGKHWLLLLAYSYQHLINFKKLLKFWPLLAAKAKVFSRSEVHIIVRDDVLLSEQFNKNLNIVSESLQSSEVVIESALLLISSLILSALLHDSNPEGFLKSLILLFELHVL